MLKICLLYDRSCMGTLKRLIRCAHSVIKDMRVKKMMNYFKMIVSEIAVFKNFEIPCYTLNLSYFTLSTHPIAPVSQGDFLHWSCSLYSWLNGCRNRTPAVISFNQSTVDFISGRKDPLYLSIGDNCCPSSQHSYIEVAVRQCMATTLDNLNYYI